MTFTGDNLTRRNLFPQRDSRLALLSGKWAGIFSSERKFYFDAVIDGAMAVQRDILRTGETPECLCALRAETAAFVELLDS